MCRTFEPLSYMVVQLLYLFFFLESSPPIIFKNLIPHCDALKFANQEITITSKVMEVKFHTRVSPLY